MTTSNLTFLAGFIMLVVIRGVYKQRTMGNEVTVRRMDGIELTLLITLMPGAFLLPLLYLFTPWVSFADYRLPLFAWIGGAVLMAAALGLFWRSQADLGRNFSQTLEMRKGHDLVMHGIYRSIRHPMYASIWLWFFAQGLLLQNWLAGWYGLAAFGLMYFVRTPREERMMSEFFGDEYLSYMRRTGRLLPKTKRSAD